MKERGMILVLLLALVIVIATAGCARQAPVSQPVTMVPAATTVPVPSTPSLRAIQPFTGTWVLTTMGTAGGTHVAYPTTGITLTLDSAGFLSGYSGCNGYTGNYVLTGISSPWGNGIDIAQLNVTGLHCLETSDQEQTYLGILQNTAAFAGDSTHLTLTSTTQDSLVFIRKATPSATTGMPYIGYGP